MLSVMSVLDEPVLKKIKSATETDESKYCIYLVKRSGVYYLSMLKLNDLKSSIDRFMC